ncbi:MAG: ATP-grasp domain-containing protein, partial [Aggregatilineales bacterium]
MFAEFDRRGIEYDRLLAYEHQFNPAIRDNDYALIINRMSPSAHTRGHGQLMNYTMQYLHYLDEIGATVLHGYETYRYEFSKANQVALLSRLGIKYPAARVIHHPSQAVDAARELAFPVITKANIGGSGAGIVQYDSPAELEAAVKAGEIDMGIDGTILVQEKLPAAGDYIVRVEVLDGQFLYAIKVALSGSFNLCPADYCLPDGTPGIQGYTPPQHIIDTVEEITRAANIEVGGVEYLINERDGKPYYYDINAMSNFVADAENVIGFDPFPRLVDFLLERAGFVPELA